MTKSAQEARSGKRSLPNENAVPIRARSRFRCRKRDGQYEVPSLTVIRLALVRVDPDQLDQALQVWNSQYGLIDESLAIDGKTMCNAIDVDGRQTHIMSAIGHQSGHCYAQKK